MVAINCNERPTENPKLMRTALTVVTVNKRRFGEVQLTRTADGFRVKMPDETHTAFPSLSAACDHVWAVAKGFRGADDYKTQMKAKKVPSGAGWRFWGLKPRRAGKGAVA